MIIVGRLFEGFTHVLANRGIATLKLVNYSPLKTFVVTNKKIRIMI